MAVAVVPTRDEADTIGMLTRRLRKWCNEVIVADGSEDVATALAASAAGARVVFVDEDGLGPAYTKAWNQIDPDVYVIHCDAGGSHAHTDVYDMLFFADTCDVLVGSRFCVGAEYHGNWRRRALSGLYAKACNFLRHADITDWTSGLRCYSPDARAIISAHQFRTTGHAWQAEALDVCLRAGLVVKEFPIRYTAGRSHLSRRRVAEAVSLLWSWT